MESPCQGIILPEHALRSPEFLREGVKSGKLEWARASRWEEARAGEKDMRRRRGERRLAGGGVPLSLPPLTSCCQTIILSAPRLREMAFWHPLGKPNSHCQLLEVLSVEKTREDSKCRELTLIVGTDACSIWRVGTF